MDRFWLSVGERRALRKRLEGCRDARLYRRLLALLEVDQGRAVAEVAESLGVTRQSIHNWLRTFRETQSASALEEAKRPGRPSLWSEAHRDVLCDLLTESPLDHGYFAANWTVPLLQEHLRRVCRREFGANTLRRRLHELGYSWTRSRYVLNPDPEQEKKTPNSPDSAAFGAAQRGAGRR